MTTTKRCTKCGETKPLSGFSKDKGQKSGLCPSCKVCNNKQQREHRAENMEFHLAKDRERRESFEYKKWWMLHLYGITPEEFDAMYIEQGGRCAICGKHQSEFKRRFCIDHCHETNEVRGLLCINCNKGIGHFYDNSDILQNAIKYLIPKRRQA